MKLNILFSMAFILIGQIVFGQDKVRRIDSLITTLHRARKFNGNILVAEKGRVLYKNSFGLANEETKERLNENSIFELASLSKPFTAMAVMMLEEKGKLKLDDEIGKHLPELDFYKGVTIRHLLHHTGGLPDYMDVMEGSFDKSKIATNKDIIDTFSRLRPQILFKPNTKYEYSNTGYALLASIIERAAGTSYSNFLDQNIFKPLKMKNTFVYNRRYAPRKVENYAYGYMYDGDLQIYVLPDVLKETDMVIWLDGIVGDGTVNSTVNDLLKWDRALYTNKLLSPKGMNQLFEAATLNDGTKTEYSIGWELRFNPSFGKTVSHSGGWPGYSTLLDRHIMTDKTIIILQNHDDVEMPITEIRNIIYEKPGSINRK